jgi:hypothetical protein
MYSFTRLTPSLVNMTESVFYGNIPALIRMIEIQTENKKHEFQNMSQKYNITN